MTGNAFVPFSKMKENFKAIQAKMYITLFHDLILFTFKNDTSIFLKQTYNHYKNFAFDWLIICMGYLTIRIINILSWSEIGTL